MTCNAHVVLIEHGPSTRAALIAGLEDCGCTIATLEPDAANPESIEAEGPNIVVIGVGEAPDAALGTARALKAGRNQRSGDGVQVPIIVLGDASQGVLNSDLVDGVVDDRLPGEALCIELAARIRSLSRLQVMQSELARRETIERRYGLSPEPLAPIGSEGMRVLAAGDFGADAKALGEAVGDDNCLTFVADPRQAIEALGEGGFETVVLAVNCADDDSGATDDWLALCDDIRENPRLFNLPILIVADTDSFADPADPFRKGATDLLFRPVVADTLRARMAMLVKQQRTRGRMQEAYRRSLHLETGDSLTGLYNFGFLHDYLGELIANARRWGRPVAIGMFDVEDMAGINDRFGYAAGDRLLRQTGGLIGRMVRGEDLTARYGGQQFCVVMPETPQGAAVRVLRRIADVVGMTEFGVVMDAEPLGITLKLGCTGLAPRDTVESLIARARDAIE